MLKFFKGFIGGVCATVLTLVLIFSVYAVATQKDISVIYNDIKVFFNGKEAVLFDANYDRVEPFIYEGSTYVPLRAVSEYLGKDVEWNEEDYTVYINDKPQAQLDKFKDNWYKSILSNMGENDIKENPSNITQEYRVANSISFLGANYISIKIFSDRTGEMSLKFYSSEIEAEGEMLYNEQVALTEEQSLDIIKLIEENHFWQIPTVHPDEELGLDGNTIFAEGIYGDKYNIASMWAPVDKYEIKKIYDGMLEYAKTLGMDYGPVVEEYYKERYGY